MNKSDPTKTNWRTSSMIAISCSGIEKVGRRQEGESACMDIK
jgi:hypothetical protein